MGYRHENAWKNGQNLVEKERAEKRANANPALDINDLATGGQIMPDNRDMVSQNDSASNSQTDNWKSIGELARALAEKAVRK